VTPAVTPRSAPVGLELGWQAVAVSHLDAVFVLEAFIRATPPRLGLGELEVPHTNEPGAA
jgi:hypothetical protein